MSSIRQLVSNRLGSHPELIGLISPPATDSQITDLFKSLRMQSQGLRQLLTVLNGEGPGSYLLGPSWRLLTASEILERHSALTDAPISIEPGCEEIESIDTWPSDWVPFCDWNGQVFGVVTCNYEHEGRVYGVDLATGIAVAWANSMEDFARIVDSELSSHDRLSIDRLMNSDLKSK